MQQQAAVMLGALASYFEAKQGFAVAMRWDGAGVLAQSDRPRSIRLESESDCAVSGSRC